MNEDPAHEVDLADKDGFDLGGDSVAFGHRDIGGNPDGDVDHQIGAEAVPMDVLDMVDARDVLEEVCYLSLRPLPGRVSIRSALAWRMIPIPVSRMMSDTRPRRGDRSRESPSGRR